MLQAAIQRLRNRKNDDEQGFTLIELMVVVLIIAILIAFAIPTFLGARRRAQDRSAQSSTRNGLSAADTVFTDDQSYLAPDVAGLVTALNTEEPSITFQEAASTDPKEVSVDADADNVYLVAESKSGNCFAIWSDKDTAGAGVQFSEVPGAVDCQGDAVMNAGGGVTWSDEF